LEKVDSKELKSANETLNGQRSTRSSTKIQEDARTNNVGSLD